MGSCRTESERDAIPIEKLTVDAYKIPSDAPESDGTYVMGRNNDGDRGIGRGR